MPVPPESIEVGKCYLTAAQRLLQVRRISRESRVTFGYRDDHLTEPEVWWAGVLNLPDFAAAAIREVPCDWTPETGGEP